MHGQTGLPYPYVWQDMRWPHCRPESDCLIWSTRCRETCEDFSEEADSPFLYLLKGSTRSSQGKAKNSQQRHLKGFAIYSSSAECCLPLRSGLYSCPNSWCCWNGFQEESAWILEVQRQWFWTFWAPLADSNAVFISPIVDSITSGLFLWHCQHKVSEPQVPPRQVLAIQRGTICQGPPSHLPENQCWETSSKILVPDPGSKVQNYLNLLSLSPETRFVLGSAKMSYWGCQQPKEQIPCRTSTPFSEVQKKNLPHLQKLPGAINHHCFLCIQICTMWNRRLPPSQASKLWECSCE